MSLIEGFLGYILNFSQMSYWGYMVLLGLFSIMGILEWLIIELLWCCCYVVVFRIFLLHFIIGWLLGIFILFHILVLHGFGSRNPMLSNLSSFIISFYLVIFKDISLGIFYIYFLFNFSYYIFSILFYMIMWLFIIYTLFSSYLLLFIFFRYYSFFWIICFRY